jgi:hypothetical protein
MSWMHRGLLAVALSGSTLLAAGSGLAKPPPSKPSAKGAPAGPRDKAVLKLDDEALGKDYLETSFIRAEQRLQQAIGMCGKALCSPGVLAQLHRDLGVVQLAGLGKVDAGKADFKKAIELDPDIALDPDFATPELRKAFDQARGAKAPKPEPKPAPRKGIAHDVVIAQALATPIPVYATFGGGGSPRLRVWYKAVGSERWASVSMEAKGDGFAGEIPCAAAAKEGDLQYFIEAVGAEDETLDKDGSRSDPHTIGIRKDFDGEAPHLPDMPPPSQCKDVCVGDECPAGGAPKHPRNNWIVLSAQQDLAIIGAGTSVCDETNQTVGEFSCFRAAGSQYHGDPLPGAGDNVNPGLAPATTRLHIGYDRVVVAGLVLGIRLGYVLRGLGPRADGGPAPLPLDVEGRVAYWFREDVFSKAGLRPFVFAGGGGAQVDTRFDVVVHEDTSKPPPPSQTDNPATQPLSAYRRMGQGWAGGGAGVMYAFVPSFGVVLDVKYMRMFPTTGNVIAPELGVALGF